MKNVTSQYTEAVKAQISNDKITGIIVSHGEIVDFELSDLVDVKITQKGTSNGDLQIGGVFAQEMTLEFYYNSEDYKRYNGSLISLVYGIKQTTQNDYESCTLNVFEVDKTERKSSTIILKAYDFMLKFDKSFTVWDNQSHTLWEWYNYCCEMCEVEIGMTQTEFNNLANAVTVGAVSIQSGGLISTYRDVLHYIAVIIGGYAYIDGVSLYFKEFKNTNPVMSIPAYLIDDGDKYSDYDVSYSTVTAKHGDNLYYAAIPSDGKTYDLGELPFFDDIPDEHIQSLYETICTNILNNLSTLNYVPFELKWTGNPAFQCGDIVSILNIDGTEQCKGVITNQDWSFDGGESLKSQGSENEDTSSTAAKSTTTTNSKEIKQINTNLKNYALKSYVDEQVGRALTEDY